MHRFINRFKSMLLHIFTFEEIGIYYLDTKKYTPKSDINIHKVTLANLTDILNFNHPRYVGVFHEFLASGDIGYYAYINNKCIHRSWVKSNEQVVYPHWACPIKLKTNQYFIHYCETAPQARGKGVYPSILSNIADDFKNKGEVLISINANNIASITGAKKAGFRGREKIKVLVIFGMKFITKQNLEF